MGRITLFITTRFAGWSFVRTVSIAGCSDTMAKARSLVQSCQCMNRQRPNQSLQPTPDGVVSSAHAGHVVVPAWLSSSR